MGAVGQAFAFDGVDDLVEVPATPALNLQQAVTIEAWVNPAPVTGPRPVQVIAGRPFGYQMNLLSDHLGRVAFPSGAGGAVNRFADSVTALPLETFTHVAGTYDATTGELRIYLTGVLETMLATTGAIDSQTKPLQIGGFADPNFTGGFFTGRLDEVRLFNRALTAAEIRASQCQDPTARPPMSTTP